jgi:hypothetical protein
MQKRNIPIRLKIRKGANARVILGRETKAQVAVPTQGSVGIRRSFTHISPSRSRPRIPKGTVIGKKPTFKVTESTILELPEYRRPMWYLPNARPSAFISSIFYQLSSYSPCKIKSQKLTKHVWKDRKWPY